jgi:VanZ family protein
LKFSDFIAAIAFFVLITVLLCLPGSALPKLSFLVTIHADKWVHVILFGTLCLLFCRPFRKTNYTDGKRRIAFLLIMMAAISYGVIMEFVQDRWVPNRSFETGDIMADAGGSLLGWLLSNRRWAGGKKIGPDRNRDRNQN